MSALLHHFILGAGLLYASFMDLKKRAVSDKVWVATLLPALVFAAVTQGGTFAGQMLVQGLILALIGLAFRLVTQFGGADILALGVAGAGFPHFLSFRIAAYIAVPMLFYMKLYHVATNRREVPAIPGIFLGYFVALYIFFGF